MSTTHGNASHLLRILRLRAYREALILALALSRFRTPVTQLNSPLSGILILRNIDASVIPAKLETPLIPSTAEPMFETPQLDATS